VAMVESAGAVAELDSILQVPGLDAVLVGPYDLSASMGLTGQFDASEFVAALASVRALAARRGIACGIHVVAPDEEQLRARLAEGYRFVAYSLDAVFLQTHAGRPGMSD
jgi:2-dehydro-3-deoxyglucarate aldolase